MIFGNRYLLRVIVVMVRVRVQLLVWNRVFLSCEVIVLLDVCTCTNDTVVPDVSGMCTAVEQCGTPCGVCLPEQCLRIFHEPTLAKDFVAFMTGPISRL